MVASMARSATFWVSLLVFEVVFGAAIFTVTRHYYMADEDRVGDRQARAREALPVWPDRVTQAESAVPGSVSATTSFDPPVALSRQADEFFNGKQYARAADLYAQLLALVPSNVDTYNNLGLTLHYLGRSAEALQKLNEGIAVDATHQRIWLTLGFVNAQIGDIEEARLALATAVLIDADSDVGESAATMLEELPR